VPRTCLSVLQNTILEKKTRKLKKIYLESEIRSKCLVISASRKLVIFHFTSCLEECSQSDPYIDHFRNLSIGLELACNGGSRGEDMTVICIWQDSCDSLTCKLVPVQYREYENFLFWGTHRSYSKIRLSAFTGATKSSRGKNKGKNKSRCRNYGQLLMSCSVDYL